MFPETILNFFDSHQDSLIISLLGIFCTMAAYSIKLFWSEYKAAQHEHKTDMLALNDRHDREIASQRAELREMTLSLLEVVNRNTAAHTKASAATDKLAQVVDSLRSRL